MHQALPRPPLGRCVAWMPSLARHQPGVRLGGQAGLELVKCGGHEYYDFDSCLRLFGGGWRLLLFESFGVAAADDGLA
jgi:hypothetical protein